MPERRFETAYWSDPFVMKLPAEAKLLYIYLWTNIHCNQAGLYEIAPATISFETGLDAGDLPALMELLKPKVAWYPDQNLVWVKNFLRRQTKSPQFLAAAAKCLESLNNNGLIRDFLDYNQKYNLSIPYQYPIDREAVFDSDTPPLTDTKPEAKGLGVAKGEGGPATPATETAMESRTAPAETLEAQGREAGTAELELLSFLETLEGWRKGRADDLAWLKEFCQEYPEFNLLLAKACRDYHSGRAPPKHKGHWKNRFREWMKHERRFQEERRGTHRQDTQRHTDYDWEETPEPDDTS